MPFQGNVLLVEKHIWGAKGGPRMVLKKIKAFFYALKLDPTGPPPIPIPGVNKSLLPVGKTIRKKHMFDDFQ